MKFQQKESFIRIRFLSLNNSDRMNKPFLSITKLYLDY